MKKITAEQVMEWLREVVAERGEDYVYSAPDESSFCMYSQKMEKGNFVGSCAVGVAFSKHLPEFFNAIALEEEQMEESWPLDELLTQGWGNIPEFTPSAQQLLLRFQTNQDNRMAYGEALRDTEQRFAVLTS